MLILAPGSLHHVDMDSTVDVSNVHNASIYRVEVRMIGVRAYTDFCPNITTLLTY